MNDALGFKNALSRPVRRGASGLGTLKVRSPSQKIQEMISIEILPYSWSVRTLCWKAFTCSVGKGQCHRDCGNCCTSQGFVNRGFQTVVRDWLSRGWIEVKQRHNRGWDGVPEVALWAKLEAPFGNHHLQTPDITLGEESGEFGGLSLLRESGGLSLL